jgi:hypothetical protein
LNKYSYRISTLFSRLVVALGGGKSCLSYWLAADPDLGFVKAAAYSGNSESTIKKWYESRISQEVAKKWFEVPVMF